MYILHFEGMDHLGRSHTFSIHSDIDIINKFKIGEKLMTKVDGKDKELCILSIERG